jgi:hypothetical protein
MPKTKFKAVFRRFVEDFGGETVPEEAEDGQRSADCFFRQHNVVAELKCLVVDQTADTLNKLSEIIDQRRADTRPQAQQLVPDDILLHFTSADGKKFTIPFDQDFQRTWQKVLLTPIENFIRDANKQIRATKERLSIPSAHGVVLIFNEGNPLHAASPQDFARLAGEVIQKPNSAERRFPHIQGMVYFSFRTIETFDEQTQEYMPFWLPAQVRGDAVEGVKRFQDDLKLGWCQYVERMSGVPVVTHQRETDWPDA